MAITFGLDISHHQPSSLNLAAARAEGIEFCFIKATEGGGYTDPEFAANLAKARKAGMLVAAYFYQRSNTSAAAHVDRIRQVAPRDVPVIPDVEANSGSIALTRQIIDALRGAGYKVPLLYLPRWYWQQIGSPSLAGLPPLWSSRYPDNTVGDFRAEYEQVEKSFPHFWNGYGGSNVAVLQYTSSARAAGYAPLDANAFRGTRNELAALLGGTTTTTAEDDMNADQERLLRDIHERMFNIQLGGQQSRIPGDTNRTTLNDAILDTVARVSMSMGTLGSVNAKVDALTALVGKQNGVTADQIAAALRAGLSADLAPILHDALKDALDDDNGETADAVATTVLAKLGEALTPKA